MPEPIQSNTQMSLMRRVALLFSLLLGLVKIMAQDPVPQLLLKVTSPEGSHDIQAVPNFWLHVPAGQAPSAFVPAGPFSALWEGFVSADLRSYFTFHAELNGSLTLVLNGKTILKTNSTGGVLIATKRVRLNKGTNSVALHFSSPEQGDAYMRLQWAERGGLPFPIPNSALSHVPTEASARSAQLHQGLELFLQHRCIQCHTTATASMAIPELQMDAPSFEEIGSRRRETWMQSWILDPSGHRPDARMPQMLHGTDARAEAEAIAAFLSSLKAPATPEPGGALNEPAASVGKKIFQDLHCASCHLAPEENAVAQTDRVSLGALAEKFHPEALHQFLKEPEAHFRWTRMPNFHLTDKEAAALSAYLMQEPVPKGEEPNSGGDVEQGRNLVQTRGCLNCHNLRLENRFATIPWAQLREGIWDSGCLAPHFHSESRAPRFGFSEEERAALRAFCAEGAGALNRFVPVEFARRNVRTLRCGECHGKHEGFPRLEILGGKMKPEWAAAFMKGKIEYKPRPWIVARMPSFPEWAEPMAQGLAMAHGFPPATPQPPPIDMEMAETGRNLVSADGGFSCIACHAVGEMEAIQVFESAGINLAYSGERLLKPFYMHWVLNPLKIDPTTKMPVYFDEQGRSPLYEVYEGDGLKQIEAMWQYMRLGDKMRPPQQP